MSASAAGLPPATRDISDHPAAGTVTDPVDKAKMNADVERKIGLYSMINALRQGRMPSNPQIDQMLQYVIDNSPVHTEKLSPNGKQLVHDTREIIETLRVMVQDKNADELLQQFFWNTRDVDANNLAKNSIAPGKEHVQGNIDQEKVAADRQQAAQHLRTLFDLVLTNSEVRKLLSDFSLIGRDLLSTGLTKAAGSLRPDEEALANVDRAGPQDQFITEGGRKIGTEETPVLEANVPGIDKSIKHDPRTDNVMVKNADGTERPADEAYGQAQQRLGEFQQRGQAELRGTQADAQQEINQRTASDEDLTEPTPKSGGLKGRLRGFRSAVSGKIPDEHKDRVERGKKFLLEDYFPEERRDQFIYRGKKVILECQKHDDYQESLKWLLSFVEEYAKHGRTIASASVDGANESAGDKNLKRSIHDIRTLLERFANGQSMDIILDAITVLSDDAKRDQELRTWFQEVDKYSRQVLLEPGFVLEPACNSRARELRDSGRQFYDGKYKEHFDRVFSSIGDFFTAMGQDPLNQRFGNDWKRLTKDLLFDNEGSLTFKKDLWNDIRRVILPELVDKVGYVPIPRIEYTDDSLDLVVENLTLSGRNLFPNIVSIEAHNFVKFSPYNTIKDEGSHRFTLTFGQIQADMRDVMFYFKKKTGIPKLSDSGIADVVLGGNGLTATATLVSAGKDRSSVFKVHDVNVKVDTLKFKIRDSKHDLLYKTLHPLAARLIKKQIQKALADAIETGFEYVDGQLVRVRDDMQTAKTDDERTRTDALKNIFKKNKDEASSTMSSSHSQFKVVSNKRQSLLVNQGHPQGWVNRAAEKDKLITQGADWRSEAFNLASHRKTGAGTAPTGVSGTSPNAPATTTV
jgi:hypothetical protein